jgi:hypothetical protein
VLIIKEFEKKKFVSEKQNIRERETEFTLHLECRQQPKPKSFCHSFLQQNNILRIYLQITTKQNLVQVTLRHESLG